MDKSKWKSYALFIGATEAVGALSGFLTKDGTKAYEAFANKPALTPPGIVFPIVWTILYALMGIGVTRVYHQPTSQMRKYGLIVFAVQLAVNFCWSLLFFNVKAYGFAFAWLMFLWGLILLMIYTFYRVDKTSAYLQIPYLLWVSFAGYLNFMVWQLN